MLKAGLFPKIDARLIGFLDRCLKTIGFSSPGAARSMRPGARSSWRLIGIGNKD
jgi:hypothetical protein